MFNASLRREKNRQLWLGDASSLSSSSSESNKMKAKRYRHRRSEESLEPRMASNPSLHTEYHQLEERSLMNSSNTRDGLETGFYRERKSSHARRPFSEPSHISDEIVGHRSRNNKRDHSYSVPKSNRKKENKTISYKIQKVFSKVKSEEGKSEFIKHILDNITPKMSREDYKHLLLEYLNSMNDVETKLECCKDIQKVLSFKVNEYQNEIEKRKNETSISDELKAYLNKVHFTDNVYRFMIAEGLTTVQFLIWVTDDCWDEFLSKRHENKCYAQLRHGCKATNKNNTIRYCQNNLICLIYIAFSIILESHIIDTILNLVEAGVEITITHLLQDFQISTMKQIQVSTVHLIFTIIKILWKRIILMVGGVT